MFLLIDLNVVPLPEVVEVFGLLSDCLEAAVHAYWLSDGLGDPVCFDAAGDAIAPDPMDIRAGNPQNGD